jgi:hypothetical protein
MISAAVREALYFRSACLPPSKVSIVALLPNVLSGSPESVVRLPVWLNDPLSSKAYRISP